MALAVAIGGTPFAATKIGTKQLQFETPAQIEPDSPWQNPNGGNETGKAAVQSTPSFSYGVDR